MRSKNLTASRGLIGLALLSFALFVPTPARADARVGLVERKWTVDGVERRALVHLPPAGLPSPVVFVFHGHGGSALSASRAGYHELWPEALVVYPQGLPTKGMTDPLGSLRGWQQDRGEEGDRDLRFFDAMLASFKAEGLVDEARVFCTGHSNGGRMTYLLWEARPALFAAFAPSASPATKAVSGYSPRPVLVVASPEDRVVPYAWQKQSIDALLLVNGCVGTAQAWGGVCDLYPSRTGNPVITLIHHGGHQLPVEAAELIIRFFREIAEKAPKPDGNN
jgi:polyhydroxybutyrate depolymerase